MFDEAANKLEKLVKEYFWITSILAVIIGIAQIVETDGDSILTSLIWVIVAIVSLYIVSLVFMLFVQMAKNVQSIKFTIEQMGDAFACDKDENVKALYVKDYPKDDIVK